MITWIDEFSYFIALYGHTSRWKTHLSKVKDTTNLTKQFT
jgi:hypothetical protein